MKQKQLFQSFKRFTAAFTLCCFMLVGVAGVQPAIQENQETSAYTETIDEVAAIIPRGNLLPSGNFWAG
jgi:hypothetical protein